MHLTCSNVSGTVKLGDRPKLAGVNPPGNYLFVQLLPNSPALRVNQAVDLTAVGEFTPCLNT
jgi:hypothetical protein